METIEYECCFASDSQDLRVTTIVRNDWFES